MLPQQPNRTGFSHRRTSLKVLVAALSFLALGWCAPDALAAPVNNNFDNATALPGLANASDTGTNIGANTEGGEPDPLGIGGRSVWWSWTAPATGWVEINTFGTDFDSLLYVFTGTDVEALTTQVVGDHADGDSQARVNLNATSGVTYKIAVHGYLGEEGDISLNVVTPGTAPPAHDNFASRIALPGTASVTQTGDSNAGATLEHFAPEPMPLVNGEASVWYSWTAPSTGQFIVDTFGSSIDTVLHVFTGSTLATLTPVAVDDDSSNGFQSRAVFNATSSVTYQIAVLGYLGEAGPITLHINPGSLTPPANDAFASRIALGSASVVNTSGGNADATIEPYEIFPLEISGASIWWTWTAPSTDYVEINTFNSDFDTALYVFTGSSIGNLTLVSSDDDSQGGFQSRVNFNANQGQVYQIAVHGWKGATGTASLEIKPGVTPPDYNSFDHEKDLGKHTSVTKVFDSGSTRGNLGCNIEPGEPDLLRNSPHFAPAEGPGGASAWFRFTADVTGTYDVNTFGSNFDTVLYLYDQKDNIADLTEIAANDNAGGGDRSQVFFSATKDKKYLIAIHGYLGATGDNITININHTLVTAPSNDPFSSRIPLPGTLADSTTGDNFAATLEDPPNEDPENAGGASVWWSWTAPSTGWVEMNTHGSTFDTYLYVFSGAFPALPFLSAVAFGDDADHTPQSELNFYATSGTTYYVSVLGFAADTGEITLNVLPGVPPPGNDDFANRISLGGAATASSSGTNVGASIEHLEPDSFTDGGASVWWSWTAPATGWVEVNTFGSNFDTLLYVFSGTTLSTLVELGADDESAGTDQSRLNFYATMGETYQVAVHGDQGSTGNINVEVKPGVSPPSNDDFANRIFLGSTATISTSGNTSGASSELLEPDPLGTAAASLWWSWQAPSSGWVQIDTFGSAFDTVLYAFTGTSISALTPVGISDNSENSPQSRIHFIATAGETYHISLNGDQGLTGPFDLNIQPGFAPVDHDNFADRLDLGKTKTSEVASWAGTNSGASLEPAEPDSLDKGGASLWFKWTADEDGYYQVDTFGSDYNTVLYLYTEDNDILMISELGFNDDAEETSQSRINFYALKDVKHRIAVHGKNDSWGNLQIRVIGGVSIPVNDDFPSATDLGSPSSAGVIATNAGASLEHGEPDPLGTGGSSVWWKWSAPADGYYEIDTLGSAIDTLLYIYTGTILTNLVLVDGNDADTAAVDQSRVSFYATMGTAYYIAVLGDGGETGGLALNIASVLDPPMNDDFAGATFLGSTVGVSDTVANLGATIELDEPDSLDEGGNSLWWKWTGPGSVWIEVNTFGSSNVSGAGLDTILYVYAGTTIDALNERAFNDSGGGTSQSRVNFLAGAGESFYIAVHGDDGEQGTVNLNLLAGVTAPPNDNQQAAIDLFSASPTSTAGSNAGASLQHGEPDSVDDGGTSVWWKWTAPSTGWVQVDTFGSGFDTLLYVFSGTNFSNFVEEGFNTEAGGTDQSMVNFYATASVTYHIAVHGDDGLTGPISLAIGPGTSPPPNDDFANAIALPGTTIASDSGSNVGAKLEHDEPDPIRDGGASVWWKWIAPSSGLFQANTFGSDFDTILYVFTGASLSTLTTVGFNDEAAGTILSRVNFQATVGETYYFAVHGDKGETGNAVINTGAGMPPPANDNYGSAIHLGSAPVVHASGNNEGATLEVDEETLLDMSPAFAPAPGPRGASIWYSWQAPSNDPVILHTFGSNFDTVLYAYSGATLLTSVEEAANDDYDGIGGVFQSCTSFTPVSGVTYHFAVHGIDGDTGDVALVVTSLTAFPTFMAKYPSLTGPDALPFADPEHDGFNNLVELALGLDPTLDSTPAGNDPNGPAAPQYVETATHMQLFYSINPANLVGGVGLPIIVKGAWTIDLFQLDVNDIAPVSLGGNDYMIEALMDSPANPSKQLGVLVVDPNP